MTFVVEHYVFNNAAFLLHRVDYFIRLGFVDEWSKIVAPDKVEEVFASLENNLNSFARERGELSLTIPMACVQARKV